MGVKFYAKGDHPAGFIGFRVTMYFDQKYRQKYFSTSPFSPTDVQFKLIELQAMALNASWQLDSFEVQRRVFLTSEHPNTKKGRGVGVQCLTLGFYKSRKGSWLPGFCVQNDEGIQERITFANRPYSEAWAEAVEKWAVYHFVSDDQRDQLLAKMPDPSQFKELRRIMITEGHDIPVEALGPVFKERRDKLKARRAPAPILPGVSRPSTDLVEEMKDWFERVR